MLNVALFPTWVSALYLPSSLPLFLPLAFLLFSTVLLHLICNNKKLKSNVKSRCVTSCFNSKWHCIYFTLYIDLASHLFSISFLASLPTLKFYPHASTLSPTHSFWTISVLFESLSLAPTTIRTKTHFSSCTLEDCTIWFQFSHQPPAVSLFPGSLCCSQTSLHIAGTYHFLPLEYLHISGCPSQPTPSKFSSHGITLAKLSLPWHLTPLTHPITWFLEPGTYLNCNKIVVFSVFLPCEDIGSMNTKSASV